MFTRNNSNIYKRGIDRGFYKVQQINLKTDIGSAGQDTSDLLLPEQTHYIIYTLVINGFATLKELRDDYDIYEVLDLYELCSISLYNKYYIMKGE
jgi:hypothetical protein